MAVLEPCGSDQLLEQLRCLLRNLRLLHQSTDPPNLSAITWATPLTILPIALVCNRRGDSTYVEPNNQDCARYLKQFHFPRGTAVLPSRLSGYIPLLRFPTNAQRVRERQRVEARLFNILVRLVGVKPGVHSAIGLAVSELLTNIEEHARTAEGWIHAQYYPHKEFLDVCIADSGVGFLGSYRHTGRTVLDAREAMRLAVTGVSTKPDRTRGTGIRTMINQVTAALRGSVLLVSGAAAAYRSGEERVRLFTLSETWSGTIVAFRVPKQTASVDYLQYVKS